MEINYILVHTYIHMFYNYKIRIKKFHSFNLSSIIYQLYKL